MEWEHLFDDLEGQLAAEWEAERVALDAESERLRISKLTLHERLRVMAPAQPRLMIELHGGERWEAVLRTIGADWMGVCASGDLRLRIVPLTALESFRADHGALLSSLSSTSPGPGLRERMTFGFVMRDLARRRSPVTVTGAGDDARHGTIDRAGADHLDLALHDPGETRRARCVRGFRVIPFSSITSVRLERAGAPML